MPKRCAKTVRQNGGKRAPEAPKPTTDNISYAVYKYGSSITHQTFRATSQSPSESDVYTVFCPSSVNTVLIPQNFCGKVKSLSPLQGLL